ncbi:hypothetical protein RPE78_02410 [Thioclava litoralis]|uniref:Lycopene cyclase domain-containing protein n=1 Tax=Thioclava litoralis TaxID=3076557 RepID=A0ABZ1E0G0_9RHOB|nr:hypothetical protein RPE78_02410 [Thioclava sp. FTW29]
MAIFLLVVPLILSIAGLRYRHKKLITIAAFCVLLPVTLWNWVYVVTFSGGPPGTMFYTPWTGYHEINASIVPSAALIALPCLYFTSDLERYFERRITAKAAIVINLACIALICLSAYLLYDYHLLQIPQI